MKLLIVLAAAAMLFSCQKSSDSSSNNGAGPGSGPQQQGEAPVRKTLKFTEILEQDLTAKETMNWGSSETFPSAKESETTVTLSYFFQENKLIKSKDIDKAKGYCELSTVAAANANGSEITLTGGDKLFRFMDFRSEKTEINNLNYQYNAMFKLTFQNSRQATASLNPRQFELACYNVLDLAELKAAIDSKFTFTKKEEKETK